MIGFGWDQLYKTWSKDVYLILIEFLDERLKNIIKKSANMKIPNEPQITIPKKKCLTILEKKTVDFNKLDLVFINDEKKIQEKNVA